MLGQIQYGESPLGMISRDEREMLSTLFWTISMSIKQIQALQGASGIPLDDERLVYGGRLSGTNCGQLAIVAQPRVSLCGPLEERADRINRAEHFLAWPAAPRSRGA